MSKQVEIKFTTTGSVKVAEQIYIDWATEDGKDWSELEDHEKIAVIEECESQNSFEGLLEPNTQSFEITEVKL